MNTPQSLISHDHASAGIFIEANILCHDAIQAACNASLDSLYQYQQQFPNDQLCMSIAFGANFWGSLKIAQQAPELKNFPSYGKGNTIAPADQCDLFIHIQSLQHDSNLTLALAVLNHFGNSITVKREIHGHRRHENRGLDGFVDGTENPQTIEKIHEIGINEYGGSYILMQRYQHHLQKWNGYNIEQQEESVARHKISNEEFPKTHRHPRSHIARTNLRENGVKLPIVRRSLPYGTASGEHGLAFVAYCARLHNIELQLQHMFGDAPDGLTDLLLERLSSALSGAYYYAPSVEDLRQLA